MKRTESQKKRFSFGGDVAPPPDRARTKKDIMRGSTVRHAEPVILNVYDLWEGNEYVLPFGLGFYHTGIVVHGYEYSFSQEGINRSEPKQAGGVRFRQSIVVGKAKLSSADVTSIINDLRSSFAPNTYDLTSKNCNSFTNRVAMKLTGNVYSSPPRVQCCRAHSQSTLTYRNRCRYTKLDQSCRLFR